MVSRVMAVKLRSKVFAHAFVRNRFAIRRILRAGHFEPATKALCRGKSKSLYTVLIRVWITAPRDVSLPVSTGTMPPMSCRTWSSRFALWAAVCALILKAAVPMFAAGAAQMRGMPVAEICTVYGVELPGASSGEHAHHHHGEHSGHEDHSSHAGAAHSGDHCALTALAALAVPDAAVPALVSGLAAPPDVMVDSSIAFRDASAAWAARLKHGPPFLA